ncbi:IS66 family insertion sequence element accessory protein TnpB [Streptococcus merionis]|uniref:IS66 family insertion sequence element accessory protein TnpB n=1 Tax=Streptococcus merionis TaxID=400065 RepID=UPI003519B8D2
MNPFSGAIFLFCGGDKDCFKSLCWDGQGFWLLYTTFTLKDAKELLENFSAPLAYTFARNYSNLML